MQIRMKESCQEVSHLLLCIAYEEVIDFIKKNEIANHKSGKKHIKRISKTVCNYRELHRNPPSVVYVAINNTFTNKWDRV